MHQSRLFRTIVIDTIVQGGPVVPHDQVSFLPLVSVDMFCSTYPRDEELLERGTLLDCHLIKALKKVVADVDRASPTDWVGSHHRVQNVWGHTCELFLVSAHLKYFAVMNLENSVKCQFRSIYATMLWYPLQTEGRRAYGVSQVKSDLVDWF